MGADATAAVERALTRRVKEGAFGRVWRENKMRFRVLGSGRKIRRDEEDNIGIVAIFKDLIVVPLKRHCNAIKLRLRLQNTVFLQLKLSLFSPRKIFKRKRKKAQQF